MKSLSLATLSAVSWVAGLCAASPTVRVRDPNNRNPYRKHLVEDVSPRSNHRQRRMAPIPVTGFPGDAEPRLELRDLESNADQWNMYILALKGMQERAETDPLSWFQIAGIHGRPIVPWNGVEGLSNPDSPGYCTHVSNLFLTWHRPYTVLYEQVLVAFALDAAQQFPEGPVRDRYEAAALTLRAPYLDWAMDQRGGGNVLPDSVTSPQISVILPTDHLGWNSTGSSNVTTSDNSINATAATLIDNPLYSYRFHARHEDFLYAKYVNWNKTLRHPTSDFVTAESDSGSLHSAVNGIRQGQKDRLYLLLTQSSQFRSFSNEGWDAGEANGRRPDAVMDSLEALHDNFHGAVGGNRAGHMGIIDVSAFDPLFMLHHVMVDRCFAIWQILYPDSYVEPSAQEYGNYWYRRGDILDVNTGLQPFYSASGGFLTSDSIRNTQDFNYYYDRFPPEMTVAQARSTVNALYGRGRPLAFGQAIQKRSKGLLGGLVSGIGGIFDKAPYYLPTFDPAGPKEPERDYIVTIRAPKNGFDQSYFVDVYLEDATARTQSAQDVPPEDDPNWVGRQAFITKFGADKMEHVYVTGTIVLTRKLSEKILSGELPGRQHAVVKRYLAAHLRWKLKKVDGTEILPESVEGLQIAVISSEVEPEKTEFEFPRWIGSVSIHDEVTRYLPGGWCPE